MILADIGESIVKRILIDDGSTVEITSYEVCQKLGLRVNDLKPTKPIYIFGNNFIHIREGITLPVIIGQGTNTLTFFAKFVVVDQPMAYNAILSRPMMKVT